MSLHIIPQNTENIEGEIDVDALLTPDPAPAPSPRPASDSNGEWASWCHRVGYWTVEMEAGDSKRRAKWTENDDGIRRSLVSVKSAWKARPNANLAIKLGFQRDTTSVFSLDADGKTARDFVEALLPPNTPKCTHPSGDGAKFFFRMPHGADLTSARLICPGCKNEGHDGLELLGQGKTATVAPSVHPNGDQYIWDVPLPDDPAKIPLIPDTILQLERVQRKIGSSNLPEDTVIRQSGTNREMTVEEWREWMQAEGKDKVASVHSPFRTDAKPSCWLTLYHGSLWLHDAATGESIKDGTYTEHSGGSRAKNTIRTDKISAPFGHHIKICKQYMGTGSDNPLVDRVVMNARMVAIKMAVGGGKTTSIADYRKCLTDLGILDENEDQSILLISHRRSLVGHSIVAYELRTDYRDIKDWKSATDADLNSLGICMDSLTGYAGKGKLASRLTGVTLTSDNLAEILYREWRLVIVDECESVFRHLHGGTLKDRSFQTWMALGNICRCHAGQVVLADAHLSDYSVNEYRALVGGDHSRDVLIENRWKRGDNHVIGKRYNGNKPDEELPCYDTIRESTAPRLVRYPAPEDLESMLLRVISTGVGKVKHGMTAYVATTSVRDAQRLTRKLRKLHPDKHIIQVTGEHDDPDGEVFLADPNGYMKEHKVDVAVCSPAVESGVSIDGKGVHAFDAAFLFGHSGAQTWQDLIQMVGRPRNLNSQWIFAWVSEHGRAPWLSENEYRQALIDARDNTYGLMREHLDVEGKVMRQPADDGHLMSHVRTVVHECRSRINLAKDFWAYWQGQDCEIMEASDDKIPDGVLTDDDRKTMRAEKRKDKKALKLERAKTIADADTRGMTVAEARKILDRDCKPAEKRRATKTLIEDFYGKTVSPELVLADDDGKLRQKVRRFNAVRMIACQGDIGIKKVLTAKDDRGVADGVSATMKHEAQASILRWELLRAAGVRPEHLNGNGDVFYGMADKDGLTEYLRRPSVQRLVKNVLGLNVIRYLEPGRRKNVTGVSLNKHQSAPVTSSDGMYHDPILENMTEDQLIDLVSAGEKNKAAQTPQPMKLILDVARQIGLKFLKKQIGSGPNRGKWEHKLSMDAVDRMIDLGDTDWERLDSTPVSTVEAINDPGMADVFQLMAG